MAGTASIVPIRPSVRPKTTHLLLATVVLTAGCSEPLYNATEPGTRLADWKHVPTRTAVPLEENPISAEVSVACRPPSQFDGDPPDVLAAICVVAEQHGTESFLGSKESHQDVSTLRVKGDGSISLD